MNKHSVLLIDDNPDMLLLIRLIIRSSVPEIHTATCVQEACQVISSESPALILLDPLMSDPAGLTGFDLLALLGQFPDTADIPVIVYTPLLYMGRMNTKWPPQVVAVVDKLNLHAAELRRVVQEYQAHTAQTAHLLPYDDGLSYSPKRITDCTVNALQRTKFEQILPPTPDLPEHSSGLALNTTSGYSREQY